MVDASYGGVWANACIGLVYSNVVELVELVRVFEGAERVLNARPARAAVGAGGAGGGKRGNLPHTRNVSFASTTASADVSGASESVDGGAAEVMLRKR